MTRYLLLSPLRRVHDLQPETVAVEAARDVRGFAWAVPARVVGDTVVTLGIGRIPHDPKHQQFASRAFMAELQRLDIFEKDDTDGVIFGDYDAVRRAWEIADLGTDITRR